MSATHGEGRLTGLSARCYKNLFRGAHVAIDRELVDILACPACRTEVRLTSDGTALVCHACRRRYAIVDDIPIMLIDEATIEPDESADSPPRSPSST